MNEEQIRKGVIELLAKPGSRPLTKSEMARQLEIHPDDRAEFRQLLNTMVEDGSLKPGKKARIEVAQEGGKGLLIGRIRIFPKGHATVYPDHNLAANGNSGFDLNVVKRVFIPPPKTGVAMDGDTVEVKVVLKRGRDGEVDPHGDITRIVKRTDRLIVGVYFNKNGRSYIQPDSEAVPQTISVEPFEEAQNGQKVAVELIQWRKGESPTGRVKELIGWPDSPGVDILSVVHKYGLQMDFEERIMEEAHRVAIEVPQSEKDRREDWTDRLVITIDPADAKDHDDAIWVQQTEEGWRLAVHIADVSHYVKPNTYLDKEALKRGNSTYLVDRVLPMLPVELSNGICSLRPDEVRLTKCAVMDFDKEGLMKKSYFVDCFINSQAKLAYEDAQVILDGGKAPERFSPELANEIEQAVKEAWKLATILRKRRFQRGALDMEMDEIKVLVDEETKAAAGFVKVEHCESHQLIEECMLAANESVAKVLRDKNKPALYRIHDDPDPEKLMEYGELARSHGYQVGDLTNRAHIQDLLDQAVGTPEEHNIKLGLLRSLKRAEYSAEPLGHYGLAKADYAHFTSPIRRYADLVVHRALQGLLKNRPEKLDKTMSQAACAEAAVHISDTERNSSFAESETKTLKLLEWLEVTRQSEDPPVFQGVITEVRSMGLFVEATDIMQKGLVKYENLPGGHGWRFDGSGPAFVKGGESMHTGMKIELKVAKVDFIEQRVDFSILGALPGQEDSKPPITTARKGGGGGGNRRGGGRRDDNRNRSGDDRNKKSGGNSRKRSSGNSTSGKRTSGRRAREERENAETQSPKNKQPKKKAAKTAKAAPAKKSAKKAAKKAAKKTANKRAPRKKAEKMEAPKKKTLAQRIFGKKDKEDK